MKAPHLVPTISEEKTAAKLRDNWGSNSSLPAGSRASRISKCHASAEVGQLSGSFDIEELDACFAVCILSPSETVRKLGLRAALLKKSLE